MIHLEPVEMIHLEPVEMNILIAHDEAFNFTYRANIDALRRMGKVSFFSPLHDTTPFSNLLPGAQRTTQDSQLLIYFLAAIPNSLPNSCRLTARCAKASGSLQNKAYGSMPNVADSCISPTTSTACLCVMSFLSKLRCTMLISI